MPATDSSLPAAVAMPLPACCRTAESETTPDFARQALQLAEVGLASEAVDGSVSRSSTAVAAVGRQTTADAVATAAVADSRSGRMIASCRQVVRTD